MGKGGGTVFVLGAVSDAARHCLSVTGVLAVLGARPGCRGNKKRMAKTCNCENAVTETGPQVFW